MPAVAGDWPHWRGPNRNGISEETAWSHEWQPTGPPVLWKASVGAGCSSVATSAGRLYTMGNREGQESVLCLDAKSGKTLWQHTYECPLEDEYFEGGPAATPTIDGDAVYTLSRRGHLFCFDSGSGAVRWSKHVAEETQRRAPTWGFAGSPLVEGNLLILNVGDAGTAVDKKSGNVVWQSEDRNAGYATPVPFGPSTDRRVLIGSGNALWAVRVADGKELWRYRWVTQFGVNAADPIPRGDEVFYSSGYGKGAVLLRIVGGEPQEVWRNKDLCCQFSSAVFIDGFLYGIDGDTTSQAVLKCIDWQTGAVRWTFEGVGSGSVMAAGKRLIVLSDRGELLVAPVSPERFEPLARAQVLEGTCWTVPVLSHGRLYCRNGAGELVCLDLRSRSGSE
jgi:outer membrane protein assembly factor BamB